MDFIIGTMIGLSILGIIYAGVYICEFGLDDSIKAFKKLFGPKYRIRKTSEGLYYPQKKIFGIYWWNSCDYTMTSEDTHINRPYYWDTDIEVVKQWIQDDIDGKHKVVQDEIISVDISTTSTVTIKE